MSTSSKYCSLLSKVAKPSTRITIADATNTINSDAYGGSIGLNCHIARRHGNGANILFLDMHSIYLSNAKINELGDGSDSVNENWHND